MLVEKGDLLEVNHITKGIFKAVAKENFDSKKELFFPLVVAPKNYRVGMLDEKWFSGEESPCRRNLCEIKKL